MLGMTILGIEMGKRNVISRNCLPTRLPLMETVILWLVLDFTRADGWVHGVSWTLAALLWVVVVMVMLAEDSKPLPGFGDEE